MKSVALARAMVQAQLRLTCLSHIVQAPAPQFGVAATMPATNRCPPIEAG